MPGLVNKGKKEHGIRASVESTGGSVYNLNAIASGELDMGVAQSDWQYHAYNGTYKFQKRDPIKTCGPYFRFIPNLLPLLPGPIPASRILRSKGKRVNIGNPGSGQRGTMEVLMDKLGWTNG